MIIPICGTIPVDEEQINVLKEFNMQIISKDKYIVEINTLEQLLDLALKIRETSGGIDELIITGYEKDEIRLEIYNSYRE